MKGIAFLPGFIGGLLTLGIILPVPAQVNSDGTTNTTVNLNGNNFNILNGIQKGNNLFHSFKEFSIPTGASATFENPSAIENIINRVTGGKISNIDGLIKANGSASVFLINPAGIVFGENASLDIGGSFLGTTAESLLFEDGFNYSAIVSEQTPLLTVSVPLGLQMGSNPEKIQVNGNGHNLRGGFPFNVAGSRGSNELRVKPGKTLGLIGGEIAINGGVLSGEAGNIQLGAIGEQNSDSLVSLTSTNTGWNFNYENINSFAPIQITQKALIDASGTQTGAIQLNGSQLEIANGSWVLIENQGDRVAGDIRLNATESLIVRGESDDQTVPTRIFNYTRSAGEGGEIQIITPKLSILELAKVLTNTTGAGNSGNLNVVATESLVVDGSLTGVDFSDVSTLFAGTAGTGNSGDITISTGKLTIFPGGQIASLTGFGAGKAGDITINVEESIDIIGTKGDATGSALIISSSFGEGVAGKIELNTAKLSLLEGSGILVTNVASGQGGDIVLNVSESLEMSGQTFRPDFGVLPSRITASTDIPSSRASRIFGLSPIPNGSSGNITIDTPNLVLDETAEIRIRNQGIGNGGSLNINANRVSLNNQSKILATTNSGTGGNIELNLQELLLMRNQSLIDTESLGIGNGGNITINSPVITGFENSDIIANAVQGNGGNINITTQGIFGLEFRDELTSESDITASSTLGVDGTVEINNISIDPNSGLFELPTEVTDSSQQIASGCSSNNDSSFIATGRGGMPQNPEEQVDTNPTWSDIRDLSAFRKQNNNTVENSQISNKPAIVEATGFIRNENGEIELVALENIPLRNKQLSECSGANT